MNNTTNESKTMNTQPQVFSHYELVDAHTGTILKRYEDGQHKAARNRANRLDNQYGAVRYVVRMVFVNA
jgi:hypothetical protein